MLAGSDSGQINTSHRLQSTEELNMFRFVSLDLSRNLTLSHRIKDFLSSLVWAIAARPIMTCARIRWSDGPSSFFLHAALHGLPPMSRLRCIYGRTGEEKLKCQVEYYKSDGKQVVEEGKKSPALRWKVRSFF